jgi:hypothetical protein
MGRGEVVSTPAALTTTPRRSVTVKLPHAICEALDDERRRTGLTVSEIIRRALVSLLLPEGEMGGGAG